MGATMQDDMKRSTYWMYYKLLSAREKSLMGEKEEIGCR
jgi:hypothetical protein